MILEGINRVRTYAFGGGFGPFLLRSVAGTGAVQIGASIATFLVGVQLARLLGVTGYGYYGLAGAIVATAGIPGEMGLSTLVMREVSAAYARGEIGQLFDVLNWGRRTAARFSAVIAVLMVAAAVVLWQVRPSPLVFALIAGAPVIPFMTRARVDCAAMRSLHQIIRSQLPTFLLKPFALSALLLCFYLFGVKLQPWSAMALNALTAAGAWLIALVWLKRYLPQPQASVPHVQERHRWIASAVPIAMSDGMRILQGQLSVLLLGLLATATDVGLFRIAVSTALVLSVPSVIIGAVVMPLISQLYAQKRLERLQKMLTRSAQAQFGGVLLLSLPLFIAPGLLLSIVYGHQYAPAANVLRIVLLGQLINTGFGVNGGVLNMTHHERRVTRAMALGLLCNVVAIAVLLPTFGLIGGAIAYVLSMLAWNVLTWLDARRFVGVDTSLIG